jgi:hypothetical protein
MSGNGKWALPGFPKRGWSCVGVDENEDLESAKAAALRPGHTDGGSDR